ncbi:hypothetical protein FCL20_05360 [Campylobacter jejuni]|nr:hypothetical protein [Campylobacter jejuni]
MLEDLIINSKRNMLRIIYHSQVSSSKNRGHPEPNYTFEELSNRFLDNEDFNRVYNNFLRNGCKPREKPSLDRIDDFKPYTLDNLQVTTIRGNEVRGHNDRRLGLGTQGRCCKKVIQYNTDGEIIRIFNSSSEAARELGLWRQNINKVCNGERDSTGGFRFQYLNS